MFLTEETPRLEIIADKLTRVGWNCGWIGTMDHTGETFLLCMRVKKRTALIGHSAIWFDCRGSRKMNPALVLPDKEGKPYTVRYDAVNAMLLNEFLKEHKAFLEERRTAEELKKEVAALTAGLQKVSAQLELVKPAPQTVLNNQ